MFRPNAVKAVVFLGTVLVLAVAGAKVQAGPPDPDYVINVSSASAFTGDDVDITVSFDLLDEGIDGWSFGLCDDTLVTISNGDVVNGSATATAQAGAPPFFQAFLFPTGGWTVGVIVSFMGVQLLPGSDLEMYIATYSTVTEGTSDLDICGTLGTPITNVEMIIDGTTALTPTTNSGSIEILDVPPIFTLLEAVDTDLIINPAGLTLQAADVEILMTHSDSMLDVGAFSFGVSHNANKLDLLEINIDGTVTEDVNGGFGPDFLVVNTDPPNGAGGTIAVVVSVNPPFDTIDQGSDQVIAHFIYHGAAGANQGDAVAVNFTDTLGSPPVDIVVSVEGVTWAPILVSGTVTVLEQDVVVHSFLRGDTNNDGLLAIADAVFLLSFLFTEGDDPDCEETANFDADPPLELADAIFFLSWLFLEGQAPPPPFPDCEIATSDLCAEDTVSCD